MKSAIQQAFVDNGSSISTINGVGLEHAPWLEQDISAEGVKVMGGLFSVTDPGSNLNPRKIIADATRATSGPGTTKKAAAKNPARGDAGSDPSDQKRRQRSARADAGRCLTGTQFGSD